MGDRANICFKDQGEIYFYTHWNGYLLNKTLANALDRGRDRWDDPPYLAGIIFSEMIKDKILEETGYGISTYIVDGKDNVLEVRPDTKMVYSPNSNIQWSYEQFMKEFK